MRARLVDAAIMVLEREGFDHLTTRSIVAEADAHLPAVNYYFGSKEALIRAAVIESFRRWGRSTLAAIEGDADGTPRELVGRALQRFLQTLQSDRASVRLALQCFARAAHDEEVREALAEAYSEFRTVVATAGQVETPHHPAPAATTFATVMIAMFDGLAIQWMVDRSSVPGAEELTAALDLLAPTEGWAERPPPVR